MSEGLSASLSDILWIINAYVLVYAVLLITAGRLGDLRGQRPLFVAGVVVFTLASLACGLSPNPTLLIAFRAVQGAGAALLMPQTMAIIIGTFPADTHPPIVYPVALLASSTNPDAKDFLAYLESDKAAPAFTKQGFTILK